MKEEKEAWELDFDWLAVRHKVKALMQAERLPNLQAILFLIGVQELGQSRMDFSKEEKQDLMHIAVCRLLSYDGHYELEGYDDEGWPHWKKISNPEEEGIVDQTNLLKEKVIQYFNFLDTQYESNEL